MYLIKTDASGNSVWVKTLNYDSDIYAIGDSVQQTSDNGYIICGDTITLYDYLYLVKIDENGIDPDSYTPTPTYTITLTSTISPTSTASPTITETFTLTQTPSYTPTSTQTLTFTPSPTITETFTISPTFSITETETVTLTITATPTVTPTYNFSGPLVVYPNPFNPNKTKLKFLDMPPGANIGIYTISGENVINIHADYPLVYWDGKNSFGSKIAPGIYFYMISTSQEVLTGKIFVIVH
jgi:hypothetical protein